MTPKSSIDPIIVMQLAEQYGYSPFMVTQLLINYPNDYLGVINAMNHPNLDTIRVNTLKITPERLKEKLERKGFRLTPVQWIPYAFNVDSSATKLQLGATHEYLQGFYYLQSIASMIPVMLMGIRPGDLVLDMCAAPGSKTTQIAQYLEEKGTILAVDNKISRIPSLKYNIRRCGIQNCIIFPFDSTQFKRMKHFRFHPSRILLDAPCSNSGIIRTDPSRKKVKSDKEIKELVRIQKALLKTGLDLLSSGGLLLYSTCSFHYQENEQVIAETLSSFPNIEIIEPFESIGLPGLDRVLLPEGEELEFGYELIKSRRLYPNIHDTDAFFICLMRKN